MEKLTVAQHLTVINGHANSLKEQVQDVNRFVNEVLAICEYDNRGMVSIKFPSILKEILDRVGQMSASISVISDEANEALDTEPNTEMPQRQIKE